MKLPACRAATTLAGILIASHCAASSSSIYAYTDERGVAHYTNLPHLDKRYRLVYKGKGGGMKVPANPAPSAQDIARYAPLVSSAAQRHGVDEGLLHAVIRVESGYNARAVSVKGASGLMQLMPATAQRYGTQNIFDPRDNIEAGTRYLRDLLALFNGDLSPALAAYNAGEGAVQRAGNRVPRYPETMAYVEKVGALYGKGRVVR